MEITEKEKELIQEIKEVGSKEIYKRLKELAEILDLKIFQEENCLNPFDLDTLQKNLQKKLFEVLSWLISEQNFRPDLLERSSLEISAEKFLWVDSP